MLTADTICQNLMQTKLVNASSNFAQPNASLMGHLHACIMLLAPCFDAFCSPKIYCFVSFLINLICALALTANFLFGCEWRKSAQRRGKVTPHPIIGFSGGKNTDFETRFAVDAIFVNLFFVFHFVFCH